MSQRQKELGALLRIFYRTEANTVDYLDARTAIYSHVASMIDAERVDCITIIDELLGGPGDHLELYAVRGAIRALSNVVCEDCPPKGYPTDKTRCLPCPRRMTFTCANEAEPGREVCSQWCGDERACPQAGAITMKAPHER